MPRYNTPHARPVPRSPIRTERYPTGRTFEDAPGYARDPKGELFLLAVTYLGDRAFYESAEQRTSRFINLVRQVAIADPEWIAGFLHWLRRDGMVRTASVIGAAEAVHALHERGIPGGRKIIADTLARADEPGEFLAYWTQTFGRKLPWPVKRGLSDAAIRLWGEYQLMKYDTPRHGYRFADVLALTHPGERRNSQHLKGRWQGDLFAHAVERRYGRSDTLDEGSFLNRIAFARSLREQAQEDPFILTDPQNVAHAGLTWEDALSLAGDRVPKAALWEAMIPTLGYEALLKNLRNFDQAGISEQAARQVERMLTDPERVARSGQFPMRFLVAYREAGLRWAWPIEQALRLSLSNIPRLRGRTLVLVDRSGSMWMGRALQEDPRSGLPRAETAAIFGAAIALAADDANLVEFGATSRVVPFLKSDSILRLMDRFSGNMLGTFTAEAIRAHYRGHDRVVIVTDEQASRSGNAEPTQYVPAHVPVYTWSLGGYERGHRAGPNRHVFGGLSDASFRQIALLEAGANASYPWQDSNL